MASARDLELVDRFMAPAEKLDVLDAGERPVKAETSRDALSGLYEKLPARLPRLYELLVRRYRWAQELDIGSCVLFANPAGPDFSGLFAQMSRDKAMWGNLSPAGYIQFALGPCGNYDAVCLDTHSAKKGDCRIVRIDHEQILCYDRVRVTEVTGDSFRELMEKATEAAEARRAARL